MLDSPRVDDLKLRFNDNGTELPLGPGMHGVGRGGDDAIGLVGDPQSPLLRSCVDRRGVWMSVADATWGVHVNGRPVQHLACLRAGDTLHVEGMEMQLLREPAPVATPPGTSAPAIPAPILRGVAGPLYGHALDAAAAEQRIRVESADGPQPSTFRANGQGMDVTSRATFRVNGFPATAATLQLGDQLAFADGQRFVLEGPGNVPKPVPALSPRAAARDAADALGQEVRRWSVPWVLVSAVVIALALLAVGILQLSYPSPKLKWAAACMVTGVLLFSGSLYVLCFVSLGGLGLLTPIGGVFLIAGWALLFLGVYKK